MEAKLTGGKAMVPTEDPGGGPGSTPRAAAPGAAGGDGGRKGGTRGRVGSLQRRRRVIWLMGLGAVAALLVVFFRPSPIPVETAAVIQGYLEVTVDTEGVTRVIDRFQIAAPVSGRMERVTVREGDSVEAGQELARLAPVPLDVRMVAQARSALAAAEARLAEASTRVSQTRESAEQITRTTDRVREVAEMGGISDDAMERAELELSNALLEHQAARSRAEAAANEVGSARAALMSVDPAGGPSAPAILRAPAAGRVLRVMERSERVVPAGTPLIEVGGALGLEVVADVLSVDAVRIRPGSPMRIEEWGGETSLPATVRLVEPAAVTRISALGVEEQRVSVVGDLEAVPAGLGDGYQVEARIVLWSASDAIKVPTSALFRSGESWSVFTVEGGRAAQRRIEIGQRGGAEAEVLAGLQPGERVVLFPSDQLRDGIRVRDED